MLAQQQLNKTTQFSDILFLKGLLKNKKLYIFKGEGIMI